MIALLSPAKTLDFTAQEQTKVYTQPRLIEQSEYLIPKLKKLSSTQIAKLMKINPNLAELNRQRFENWETPFTPQNAKQAILAFRGDVSRGLAADGFSESDLAFCQDKVRLLSGLYGLLRPLDLIQPYRLEMGLRFKVTEAKTNLYKFWGSQICDLLKKDLGDGMILNLASNEYFAAINKNEFKGRIINFHFRELKNGEYKPAMTYAKLGRGYMTRYLIENRISNPEELKNFNLKKYSYNDKLSETNEWVFTRDEIEL
jgi:cytoplasmic iron level regulating protein YaaA (DUF328/UPF0246 family)